MNEENKLYLKNKQSEIEKLIKDYLSLKKLLPQKSVVESMEYSLLIGGKRLRPILMNEVYKMYCGKNEVIKKFMLAIEMVHTYSLIHDDLPAMDNDDFRRGKPTNHKVYGEDIAILAGDGLLNMAFECALSSFDCDGVDKSSIVFALQVLSEKTGIMGMIGGQTLDVANEKQESNDFTLEQNISKLENICYLKTGALIEASMMVGAILAGANKTEVKRMELVARKIGLAFQIQDDVLDVTSTKEVLGKDVGSDAKNNKLTFVSLLGIENAREKISELIEESIKLLEESNYKNSFLKELLISLVDRQM